MVPGGVFSVEEGCAGFRSSVPSSVPRWSAASPSSSRAARARRAAASDAVLGTATSTRGSGGARRGRRGMDPGAWGLVDCVEFAVKHGVETLFRATIILHVSARVRQGGVDTPRCPACPGWRLEADFQPEPAASGILCVPRSTWVVCRIGLARARRRSTLPGVQVDRTRRAPGYRRRASLPGPVAVRQPQRQDNHPADLQREADHGV